MIGAQLGWIPICGFVSSLQSYWIQGVATVKYFRKRVSQGQPLLPEERWAATEARLDQLLRAAEANLQANSELRQQQQEQQRQLEAERRHSEALRDSAADLRTSVMELREGQAFWQNQVDELRACLRDLVKEQSQLVQIIAQQQQILRDFQDVTRALLERMSADHGDFRHAISALLEQLHQTLQYLILKAGGTVPEPVRHPEAPEADPMPNKPVSSTTPGEEAKS
jgi:chromosome segregation ATPase